MNQRKNGYMQQQYTQGVKRYCQTLELVNDAKLIEEYKYWHQSENIWPEIPAGIREVGILNMEIYLHGNLLFMIVETLADFEWDKAFGKLAQLERQAEWEEFMGRYQLVMPGASSSEKWQLMERVFTL